MKFNFKQEYHKYILGLLVFLQIILLVNFKFTAWPEMIAWPYLVINGFRPYADIGIAHTPVLVGALSAFYKLFGVGILQLKIFTWALIILSDILIYFVVDKVWNKKTAVIAVAIFSFWQIFFEGNGLWFDSVLVPLAILLFYIFKSKKYFLTGIVWGLMFMTKQTAVWFIIPLAYAILTDRTAKKSIKSIISGAATSALTVLFVLFLSGTLPDFLRWAIGFGVFILPKAQGQVQFPDLKGLIRAVSPFVILLPLFLEKKRKLKSENFNLFFWIVAGSMGAYPRFELFHFQPAMPFLAIGSAIFAVKYFNFKSLLMRFFVTLYILGSLYLFAAFFVKNWKEGTRFYEANVLTISEYVNKNTAPEDTIFVMNWWDNVYAFSGRLPGVKPLVPLLSWYQELSGIQDSEVESLRQYSPEMILLYPYTPAGLSGYVPRKVYDYILDNYFLKEKIDGIEIYLKNPRI